MNPLRLLPALASVLAVAWTLPAVAAAVVLPPSGADAGPPVIAPGARGGAIVAWTTRQPDGSGTAVELRERHADGRFGPIQEVLRAQVVERPLVALRPDGSALVVVSRGSGTLPDELVVVRRASAEASFGRAERIASGAGAYVDTVASAANARGDVVAVARVGREAVLAVAAADGPPTTTVQLGRVETAGVAVADDGELRLLTFDGAQKVSARTGRVGGALAEPQTLARLRNRPELNVAIDGQGVATAAFSRGLPGNAIGVVAARARRGRPFSAPVILDRGPNAQIARVAAGGSTTAVAWLDLTAPDPVRVALARGPGEFARALSPATPTTRAPGEGGRYPSVAGSVGLAADADGDVLLAFAYGPFSAVHAALRRAGARGFTRPRVLSALGRGGQPVASLLADRTPFVATSNGTAITVASRVGGFAPDLRTPGVTTTALSRRELHADGTVTTTVRCSTPCVLRASARLTTGRGRDLVISRQSRSPQVLRPAGRRLTLSFALTLAGRARLASTGRAQARVIVTAANLTGANRTSRQAVELGRR